MFTAAHPTAFGRSQGFANAYARIGVETSVNSASAHKLIELLFNGFMDAVVLARGAMRARQIETKGKAISRAARIIEEGLKAGLNMEDGGRLAEDLASLYARRMRAPDRPAARRLGHHRPQGRGWHPVITHCTAIASPPMSTTLLNYYEAIERASAEMLAAARAGNWDEVVKLEGACAVLIAQLKNAAQSSHLQQNEAKEKSRIMQRILLNDAEIRHLAEPWLEDLDQMLGGRPALLH